MDSEDPRNLDTSSVSRVENEHQHKKTVSNRWAGGLSEAELARPGGILLAMLVHQANLNGHALGTMADELNVTYGYINQLRNRHREIAHLSDEFATACALYLGVPRLTVLLAAGRIRPEDVFEQPNEMISALPAALQLIERHPSFGPMMPATIYAAEPQMQLFIVSLFEAATNCKLLPGRHNPSDIAFAIQMFAERRAKLVAKVEADRRRKNKKKGSAKRR